ncbi:hypothetical protein OF117_12115 [Geodermatophilus sp. YIM 151500]|uniref:hypothetical protein n=1 Tax=Geodermatophilus sp. YIM 151500 TaxID=2984531 RepID=UPI0021E4603F|nr:hypothetical protein [Geodermatophilus sp. YIM 151500]MCV2490108.1 hypothetical protein [Geodermatophilus sp. YIM 151500]
MIAETLAGLPAGAAEVTEVHVPGQPDPGLPEHLEMCIVPRAPGAADITIRVYEQFDGRSGRVDIYVSDSPPIELTTPIDVNEGPPRPSLDVVREVIEDVTRGEVDLGTISGSDHRLVMLWRWGSREEDYHYPKRMRITWSAATPWS